MAEKKRSNSEIVISDVGYLEIDVRVAGLESSIRCETVAQAVSKVIQLKEWFPSDTVYISVY